MDGNNNDKTKPKGWKLYKFIDIAEIIGGGTPSKNNPDFWNGNIDWLTVADFNTGRKYVRHAEQKITQLGLEKSSTKILKKGQIIISARGTVGAIAVLEKDMAFNQSNYGINAKDNITFNDFVYYLLKYKLSELKQASYGAVFDTITKSTFENLEILLPPPPEQKAIAYVLSSLDDKIDLLHRQNQTLEKIAETLFRKWFIEDAKDDWEEKFLKDIYIFEKGFEPGSKNYIEEKGTNTVRFIRVGDMLNPNGEVFIDKRLVVKTCKEDDLLVSFDGTVGRVIFGIEGAYSSGIRKIYSKNLTYDNLGLKYLIFKSKDIQELINSHATGTVILHASSSIDYLSFNFPPEDYIKEFNKLISPIFEKILINKRQIRSLDQMRDALLPKLMSGEIRIMNNE